MLAKHGQNGSIRYFLWLAEHTKSKVSLFIICSAHLKGSSPILKFLRRRTAKTYTSFINTYRITDFFKSENEGIAKVWRIFQTEILIPLLWLWKMQKSKIYEGHNIAVAKLSILSDRIDWWILINSLIYKSLFYYSLIYCADIICLGDTHMGIFRLGACMPFEYQQ